MVMELEGLSKEVAGVKEYGRRTQGNMRWI
jgi:hypothetical protein